MAPTKQAAKTAVENADGDAAPIPLDLLTEEVLGRISPLEAAPFLTVCKTWAATILSRLAKPTPHLFALQAPSAPQPGEEPRRRGEIFSLPIYGSKKEDQLSPVMPAKLPLMASLACANHMRLSGALPNGCVSFAFPHADPATGGGRWSPERSNHVFVVNPVTGAAERVEVYGRESLFRCQPKVRAAAGAGADAFFVGEAGRNVSLRWRAEGEQEWRPRVELPMAVPSLAMLCTGAMDLVAYADGVFYAMEFLGVTFAAVTRMTPPMRLFRLNVRSILEQYTSISGTGFLQSCHMLVSEGEVLFVGPVLDTPAEPCKFVDDDNAALGGFKVFRLEVSVEGARWAKVERLAGDRALFVSQQSSFSVRASETPGCRSNCIYFVADLGEKHCNSNTNCTWGVYSMEEDKVLFQSSVGSPGKYKAARWFLPRVGKSQAHSSATGASATNGKKRKFQEA